MYLNKAPASTGALWFRRGIALFSQNFLVFLALNCAYLLTTMATALIPIVNAVAPFFTLPFIAVLFMTASRAVYTHQTVSFHMFTAVFRADSGRLFARRLAIFGVCNLALNVLLFAVSAVFDGGKLMRMVLLGQSIDAATFANGALPAGTLIAFLFVMTIYAPLFILFWLAPVLSAWHQIPPHKALFFSWMACWRNLGAFIVLIMLWIGTAFLTSLALTGLLQLLGLAKNVLISAWFFVSMVLISMFWCSLYISYTSCFEDTKRSTC